MVRMSAATFCSGVGAPEFAGKEFYDFLYSCEFDKFPSEVLKLRFPNVPNLGDMTKVRENELYKNTNPEIMIAGTPCQGFSISGLRGGLEDDRSKLSLEFIRILEEKRPRWFLWENVPGVLSSNEGSDFREIIAAFTQCGYGLSWRILNSSGFGVAQVRRRIFVVGYLGAWEPSFRVLFESEELHEYIKSGQGARKSSSPGINKRPTVSSSGRGLVIPIDLQTATRHDKRGNAFGVKSDGDPSYTLLTSPTCGVFVDGVARLLTPLEYERLQGFPDNWTAINGDKTPEGPRYKCMGNSMAVPNMAWIMDRIFIEDKRLKAIKK